ncbi:MAG: tetratricopeptide repeat protein [Nitrospirae bacterium]|nr:tetratricopeptide repeat protein [Nitrospirota bacterium]
MNTEEADFIREVDGLHARLGTLEPHELLGIQEGADAETLKRSYYRMARRFHPDRYYSHEEDGLRNKLTDIFEAISKAYETLKNGSAADAPSSYETEPPDTGPPAHERAVQAEEQYRRGIREYKTGNYWQAIDAFGWATRLNPDKPKYWSRLSLALTRIPGRLKQAEEALREAIRLEPFNGEHHARLGRIYLKAGLKKRARTHFEKALKFDSGNEEALKGLEELGPPG